MIHDECNFLISMLETKADFLAKSGIDLLNERDKLKAENAKLRDMVAKYSQVASIETKHCSSLCAEGEPCMIAERCPAWPLL